MSMKSLFNIPAVLLLGLGIGFASLSAARAASPVQVASTAPPAFGSGLPNVAAGSNLIELYYWHHRHYWRHRYYYHRWHYRHWHYRHYRHWHYRHYRHWHYWHHRHWYHRHYWH
jgi:hypothetical protein